MSFSSFFLPLFRSATSPPPSSSLRPRCSAKNSTDLGIISLPSSCLFWTFTFTKLMWSGAAPASEFFYLFFWPVLGWTQPWQPCANAVLVSRVGFALVEWCPVFVCLRLKENNCVRVGVCVCFVLVCACALVLAAGSGSGAVAA